MAFSLDRIVLVVLALGAIFLGGRAWLEDHPEHNPWAPLSLGDPPGWATGRKLAELRDDTPACRAFLGRSGIESEPLAATGSDACRREDRAVLAAAQTADVALSPGGAQATCSIDAGLAYWLRQGIQPRAEALLGSRVARLTHLGTYSCRRIGGGEEGNWSEHATGNAIDIAAFVLEDGREISVLRDWAGEGEAGDDDEARFLRAVRNDACTAFSTVLSPDYNAAHADHFHLDQARRSAGWSACR